MDISPITNGMAMSEVRTILNQVIEKINRINESPTDYNDLENKPKINGVTLTSTTSMSDFNIDIEDTSIVSSLQELASETAETTAASVASRTIETAVATKLTKAFEDIAARQYEFSEDTLVAIRHNGVSYKATMRDLATYIAYLIDSGNCPCNNNSSSNNTTTSSANA